MTGSSKCYTAAVQSAESSRSLQIFAVEKCLMPTPYALLFSPLASVIVNCGKCLCLKRFYISAACYSLNTNYGKTMEVLGLQDEA